MALKVATSRFQNGEVIVESGLAPVRITLGHPRWKLSYELAGTIMDLAPDQAWVNTPDDEVFERHMNAKLFRVGPTRITEMVDSMATGYAGVVLLCYEKVPGPELCHRTTVGEWMNVNLGWHVDELEDRSKPPRGPGKRGNTTNRNPVNMDAQGSLFEMPVVASARVLKKAETLLLKGMVHRGVGAAFFVEPSSGVEMYTVVVEPPSCTCKWGQANRDRPCSHLLAAEYLFHHGLPPAARRVGYLG